MRISFGRTKFKDEKKGGVHPEIFWDADKAINGIMLVAGASGVGKTYRLRDMIGQVGKDNPDVLFHVIDVHGDISVPGASTVKFSEATGYGLNPLEVSSDKDFGGVRKRCRTFINMLNQTSRKLGSKQEACLLNILEDMYRAGGFYADDPRSWSMDFDPRRNPRWPKRQPTVSNLMAMATWKLKQSMIGASIPAMIKFDELTKAYQRLERAHNAQLTGDKSMELAQLKEECKAAYGSWIDSIETSRQLDDILKATNREVVRSVVERIKLIDSSGIFKDKAPDFDPKASVRRYDIMALNTDEQIMFVNTLIEDLFMRAKQSGEKPRPQEFIVLDEAQKFVSEDADHIINQVSREARKFGLGIILASQSLSHFPEDVIANAGCKIILGLDESYHDSTSRKLKIEPKRFQYIVPQKTALIQVKNKGDLSNRFVDVVLD